MVFDKMPAHRIAFDTADTTFYGKGVKLAGRLVLPKGQGAVPIVVLVHGSENYSGRDYYMLQRLLPAEGVGVFAYGKRGTGRSPWLCSPAPSTASMSSRPNQTERASSPATPRATSP
jgi:cephalosporin-C deacetylase-like acetyl esterase